MRRTLVALALALGSVAGALLFRRRAVARSERAVLSYDDGSVVTLEPGSPQGDRLLVLGRDLLARAG